MKYSAFFFLLFFSLTTFAQAPVTIRGNVTNLKDYKLAFVYRSPVKKVYDTVALSNGHFSTTINISGMQEIAVYPHNYYEDAIPTQRAGRFFMNPMLILFVAPGDTINIDGDASRFWEANVSDGKYNADFARLRNITLPLITERHHLLAEQYSEQNRKDSAAILTMQEARFDIMKFTKRIVSDFYKTNKNSTYAFYKFSEDLKSMTPAEIEELLAAYSPELQQSPLADKINAYLEKVKTVAVGSKMIDFTAKTLDGKAFDSKTLRGKYVLLDFWGSWCGPCRKSNPHLKELYKAYKDKGFELVGIAEEMTSSADAAKKRVQKAVKEDGLPWIQLLNNEMKEKQDLVKAYNVKGFPTKYLINQEGVIIWKGSGLNSPELDEKLKDIFK